MEGWRSEEASPADPGGVFLVRPHTPCSKRPTALLQQEARLESEVTPHGARVCWRIVLTKGTRLYSDSEIATESRSLGWGFRAEGFAESTVVQGGGLARNLPEFLELLSAVIQGASYPEDQISLWQDEPVEERASRGKDIGTGKNIFSTLRLRTNQGPSSILDQFA